ncbi:hypothetical protein [Bartonella sp. A05]|uniref:hypothetical protein n=1 Tax=Bartonella sp. A05 TaxID=2967261 RepID=UPI0022A8F1F4|nr:hypothetical protein [Bartonella sp. A05]MCZ2204357.1 hypothetical protein [Bartonella sp. A05]
MLRFRVFFSVILCFSFIISAIQITSAVQAYIITNEELITLEKASFAYSKALQEADANAILNAIPPQIIDRLAAEKNFNKSQFQKIMKSQIEQLAKNYKIENITIDKTRRREGKLDNGMPYFVIPLEFAIINNGEKKCCMQTEVIALLDNNHWYFIRNNNKAILDITNQVFPGLEKIKTMKTQ